MERKATPMSNNSHKSTNGDYSSPVAHEIRALAPHIHPPVPNPAPLALFAFGLTTALLQVKHTRLGGTDETSLEAVDNVCFGFAIFFGGLLQFVGGLAEVKRNNVFGYTGFLVYGGFWMSYGATLFLVKMTSLPVNAQAVQAMLALMGIFTFVMLLCTMVMHVTITVLMFLLMMTFFLLAAGVENEMVDRIGGWFGMATAATAYWLASAELLNDVVGGVSDKGLIPLGQWKDIADRIHGFKRRPSLTRNKRVQPESIHQDVEEGREEANDSRFSKGASFYA